MRRLGLLLLFAALTVSACRGGVRRFPLAPPLWVDNDMNHVPERPSKYYSGLLADGADQMVFRPLAYGFALPMPGESVNVNSMDEVPNSAWFTNRIGMFEMTPEEAYQGACGDDPPLSADQAPWTVTAAKPNGANPGFFIKAADGRRYLLKFDSPLQPTRATGSDVFGSKVYHAAGFWTPCNEVVFFRSDILKIDPEATAENALGQDVPITNADIDKVLSSAFRDKNGVLRASASRFVPGRPIGPFKYEGTRGDDPNDVVDHQDRRELRGSRILAAWINHFDSREQNSLDVWIKAKDDHTYLRHYFIDWGDSLGGRWPFDQISRRLGRSYYWDWRHFFTDLISFGFIPRTWNRLQINPFDQFGYFDGPTFTASKWKGGYPNPAHDRMSVRDALWMVRIISNIEERHVRAMVKASRFPDPRLTEFIVKRLMQRRQRIFEEYLTKYSPLSNFQVARRTPGSKVQSFCFENLALKHGVANLEHTYYKMRFRGGRRLGPRENLSDEELGWLQFRPDLEHPHRACVVLPVGHRRPADLAKNAPDNDPLRYGILDIFVHQTRAVRPTSETRIHFYDLGHERGFQLVGVERPTQPILPDLY
ncbi:MAG: hypothetical protein AAFN74_17265 [Myxococcota bacterium]